uniref:Methionine-R-sulfoxide reductase B1 n=1 Tax=Loxodonta africana TaxID=9785 RepID=G3THA0_LOXAF
MSFCSFFRSEVFQNHFEPGVYVCAKCGYELFSSRSKYAHSSPWPAFTETIHADSVGKHPEHNRPEALKVGAGNRGFCQLNAQRAHRSAALSRALCLPHSSRGLEVAQPAARRHEGTCHPRQLGKALILAIGWETGEVSCSTSRTRSSMPCHR